MRRAVEPALKAVLEPIPLLNTLVAGPTLGRDILVASVILAIMILPTIMSITREVILILAPPLDSLEICRRLREDRATLHVSRIPILVVGVNDDVEAVVALEIGADDYLPRTAPARLLLAHVKALLRRVEFATSPVSGEATHLTSGDLSLDLVTREARRAGDALAMSPREFDLLGYLVAHAREIVTRDHILTRVWGYEAVRETNSLDVHVNWLRTKIEPEPCRPVRLRTLRGRGYIFTG